MAFFIISPLILFIYDKAILWELCQEDKVAEWATAIFYFISFLVFLYLYVKKENRNIWHLLLGMLFLLICAEEISWGQRLFKFQTPEVLIEINVQEEFNLHNLKYLYLHARAAGLFILFSICCIIPLTNEIAERFRIFYKKISIPIYPLQLIFIPLLALACMLIPRLFFGKVIFCADEIGEMYLSIGFLLFSLHEYKRVSKK